MHSSLKRSASTASLPTPPPTRRRPKRARNNKDIVSVSDSDSDPSPAPILFRLPPRAPISPPPSHRRTQSQQPKPSPPATPKRQLRARDHRPVRDSPNNPFLSDTPLSLSSRTVLELERPTTPTPADYAEKPTITYVFRGVKAEFANPLYRPDADAGPSTPPAHTLPLADPDYSPDMRCPPRLLFRAARRQQAKRGAKTARARIESGSESEGDGVARKLTFEKEVKPAEAQLVVEAEARDGVEADEQHGAEADERHSVEGGEQHGVEADEQHGVEADEQPDERHSVVPDASEGDKAGERV